MDGVRHWLWRAVDEYGFILNVLLRRHRDTEAAKTFLTRLLGEYDVPEVIHTDQLHSYGAAIREMPSLINVDQQQVISTARCNNIIEQRASVVIGAVLPKTITPSYTVTRAKSARFQTAKTRSRIPEPVRPDREPSPSLPHQRFRSDQRKQPDASVPDVVSGHGRGGPGKGAHPTDLRSVRDSHFDWSGECRSRADPGQCAADARPKRDHAADQRAKCDETLRRVSNVEETVLGTAFLGSRILLHDRGSGDGGDRVVASIDFVGEFKRGSPNPVFLGVARR